MSPSIGFSRVFAIQRSCPPQHSFHQPRANRRSLRHRHPRKRIGHIHQRQLSRSPGRLRRSHQQIKRRRPHSSMLRYHTVSPIVAPLHRQQTQQATTPHHIQRPRIRRHRTASLPEYKANNPASSLSARGGMHPPEIAPTRSLHVSSTFPPPRQTHLRQLRHCNKMKAIPLTHPPKHHRFLPSLT